MGGEPIVDTWIPQIEKIIPLTALPPFATSSEHRESLFLFPYLVLSTILLRTPPRFSAAKSKHVRRQTMTKRPQSDSTEPEHLGSPGQLRNEDIAVRLVGSPELLCQIVLRASIPLFHTAAQLSAPSGRSVL